LEQICELMFVMLATVPNLKTTSHIDGGRHMRPD